MINKSKAFVYIYDFFSAGLPDNYKTELEDDINHVNNPRGKFVSLIFVILEFFQIIVTVIIKGNKIFQGLDRSYMIMYFIFLLAMASFFILFSYYGKNIILHRKEIRIAGTIFTSIILIWCAGISLLDQYSSGQIMVYVVAVISVAVSPILKPLDILLIYLFIQSGFNILLPFFSKAGVYPLGNLINSTTFVVISWAISCMRYKKHTSEFKNKKIIQEKNIELKRINAELESANQKLKMLSQTDALTGIYNRLIFDKTIEVEWNRCRRQSDYLSLIIIDIDYFKNFNDHYGHQAGDECLKRVAGVLNSCAKRSSDTVARYGGEEFVIILPHINSENAYSLAEKSRKTVEELKIPHDFSSVAKHVTISIGVNSKIPSEKMSIDQLIKDADQALYKAKIKRNTTVIA